MIEKNVKEVVVAYFKLVSTRDNTTGFASQTNQKQVDVSLTCHDTGHSNWGLSWSSLNTPSVSTKPLVAVAFLRLENEINFHVRFWNVQWSIIHHWDMEECHVHWDTSLRVMQQCCLCYRDSYIAMLYVLQRQLYSNAVCATETVI
jgi:hypothetical protein